MNELDLRCLVIHVIHDLWLILKILAGTIGTSNRLGMQPCEMGLECLPCRTCRAQRSNHQFRVRPRTLGPTSRAPTPVERPQTK